LPTPEDAPDAKTGGLSRKYSNKRIFLSNNGPKNPSPTIQEGRTVIDGSGLDPSAAAMVASTHLTASVRDNGIGSPNQPQPSPTSPAYRDAPGSGGPMSRPFPRTEASEYGVTLASTPALTSSASAAVERMSAVSERISSASTIVTPPASNLSMTGSATPGSGGGGGGSASSTPGPPVEIFKSFRVSIEDPCYKVLPVALKKYNIAADWRQYALYIVYGDQERCLGLTEKPLILFKQLDREGRKPMFMLRKHAAPAEGHISVVQPTAAAPGNAAALPGGVL
jgi:protein STE50